MGSREHRRVLKKSDINRDKILMCIRRVAAITSLKLGITEEDTLYGFGWEHILSRSKNMNKKNIIKDTRGKVEKGLVWKKDGIRDLIM